MDCWVGTPDVEDCLSLSTSCRRQVSIIFCAIFVLSILLAGDCAVLGQTKALSTSLSKGAEQEMLDPCLGLRWRIVGNPISAGGPVRLALLSGWSARRARSRNNIAAVVSDRSLPAIRVGDQVVVEQESTQLHARLAATAIESGAVGSRMRVKLRWGNSSQITANGPVILVVVTGLRQAKWLSVDRGNG